MKLLILDRIELFKVKYLTSNVNVLYLNYTLKILAVGFYFTLLLFFFINPLISCIILLLLSLVFTLIIFSSLKISIFGLSFVLIFVGGILIMFIMVCSVIPNEIYYSVKMFFFIPLILIFYVIFDFGGFYNSFSIKISFSNSFFIFFCLMLSYFFFYLFMFFKRYNFTFFFLLFN